MPVPRLIVKFSSSRLKQEYYRSCQLLGTTMSAQVHRTVLSVISDARKRYPQAFKQRASNDEDLVLESLEERYNTVLDIQMYTRLEKARVIEILGGLVARGVVRQGRERRENAMRGPRVAVYTIITEDQLSVLSAK